MRLDVLVVDPVVLGHDAATVLGRIVAEIPSLGALVCTGPTSVGQCVRGLRGGVDDHHHRQRRAMPPTAELPLSTEPVANSFIRPVML